MPKDHPEILLTGGTGLTGSHTLYRLVKENLKVRALVKPGSNYRERIRTVFSWYCQEPDSLISNIDFFEGDLNEIPSLEAAFLGISVVFHIAALVSTKKSDRDRLFKINAEGTANIVNIALVKDIKWLGYVSSVATLGPNPEGLTDEDYFWKASPGKSDYSVSKYAAEQQVRRSIEEGLPAVIINPSFIVGPSMNNSGSVSVFHAVKKGLPFYVNGLAGYVDARDVAESLWQLYQQKIIGARYIVSAENLETPVFINKVADALQVKAPRNEAPGFILRTFLLFTRIASLFSGKSSSINSTSIRMAKNRNRYDNSRLKDLTGLKYHSVDEAIENTVKHLKMRDH